MCQPDGPAAPLGLPVTPSQVQEQPEAGEATLAPSSDVSVGTQPLHEPGDRTDTPVQPVGAPLEPAKEEVSVCSGALGMQGKPWAGIFSLSALPESSRAL